MKRKAIDELIKWKELNNRKPILLTGAKGVGKTYLAYDFAKAFFEHIEYIQFKNNLLMQDMFMPDDIDESKNRLKKHFHLNSDNPKEAGILILDEISYCDNAVKIVKDGLLSDLFYHIICISSNHIPESKTGDMLRLPINPLEFDEFLRASGNEWYIDLIHTHFINNNKLPDIVHKELLDLHNLYLGIGGMPGSVNEFINFNSSVNVSEQHNLLLGAYRDYIQKENDDSDALKMIQVLDSISHQLMKDNKKFQYKLIRRGTTHTMYKEAIQKLSDLNYIVKCNRMTNEIIDSKDHINWEAIIQDDTNANFKLYLLDTGMLYSKISEEYNTVVDNRFIRALLENYMAQSLHAKNYKFFFWESDSMAKIDYIIGKGENLIPIELHDGSNTRSKSLSIFKQKYEFPYAIKISTKNFEFTNNIKYVPYYAVFCI